MPKKAKVKPGTYPLHRERQRRRILDAARGLFDQRGIDRATMAEIVSACGLQPSTLYEYFSKKDEIVWAIFRELVAKDTDGIERCVGDATSGLLKIAALFGYMADQLSQSPADVRFMAQFDAMYARNWPVERLLTLEAEFSDEGLSVFGRLIREGMEDGSLRADLEPEVTLHAVINAVLGAQRRLASLGTKVETEYGQTVQRLFQEIIRITLLGLQAPGRTTTATRLSGRKGVMRKRSS